MLTALSRAGRNFAGGVNRATERWRWPAAAGCIAGGALWVIWYFTRPACTMESAAQGLCNPGVAAQYINHQIAAQCMLVGMAATTLKGGYDELMLNRERKRADEAEERLAEERLKLDEERRRNDKRMENFYAELQQERRRNDERMENFYAELRQERQRNDAVQQQNYAAQQETLNHIAETQSLLVQMLQGRQNGHDQADPEN